jgi:hypothetical protein
MRVRLRGNSPAVPEGPVIVYYRYAKVFSNRAARGTRRSGVPR